MPKEKALCKCLSIIMLDSVIKVKKKVFSSNTFGRMLIWTKKDRNREPYWWWFRKKVCLINLDNEADNDSNDASSEYLLKAEKVF